MVKSFVPPDNIVLWPGDHTHLDALCERLEKAGESEIGISNAVGISRGSVYRYVQRQRYKAESYKVAMKLIRKGPILLTNNLPNAKYYAALDEGCYTVMDVMKNGGVKCGRNFKIMMHDIIAKQDGVYFANDKALEHYWVKINTTG